MVKIGRYNYERSTRKDKKLMVVVDNKLIHFGARDMEHFKDRTGIWKELDHNDKKRRENYLKRSKAIKNKKGELTFNNPLSPNYHSIKILWSG